MDQARRKAMRNSPPALCILCVIGLSVTWAWSSGDSESTAGGGGSKNQGGAGTGGTPMQGGSGGMGGSAGSGASGVGGFSGGTSVGCKNDGVCDRNDDCVCPDCDAEHLLCLPDLCDHNGTCDRYTEVCS